MISNSLFKKILSLQKCNDISKVNVVDMDSFNKCINHIYLKSYIFCLHDSTGLFKLVLLVFF